MPLPIELFMREYYEPRLLSRIIGGEKFKQITALTDLNRTQPEVAIMQVFKNEEKEDQVSVTIKIADVVKNKTDKNGTSFEQWSGAYDLRVFRDGQLVGYFPDEAGKIEVDHATKSRLVTFNDIKLPSGTKNDSITFSAYAFNKDKVKSTTAKYEFPITKSLGKRRSRAYIIAIGVNAHENPSWDLRYAANDAVAINSIVKNQLEKTGVFDEIISIPLISRYSSDTTPKKKLEANPVTKAMIKEVFARLAGETTGSEKLLKIIPNAVNLKQATPDDMLLISYSGHGLADENRQFHLFPYDIGMGSNRVVDDELLHHTISSDNLSLWLRDVDAGEIIMIIDACNSAASVEGEDFKPGPMGSRGLGQLAYDKRMRILAASQAEAVALESDLIKHGVLTYALIQEGLEAERADHEPKDKRIFAGEWLTYGEARVPELYRLIRSGQADKLANSVGQKGQIYHFTPDSINKKERSINVQQPTLFDFTKNESDFVLTILK